MRVLDRAAGRDEQLQTIMGGQLVAVTEFGDWNAFGVPK
jgi:hypothetical protein